ncbi:hypothetical protein DB347_10435 [Opitutaceae bacterium EW11]|nr:hypothetical protein DB347_10435 [Opitutaceae bacterium EW11]
MDWEKLDWAALDRLRDGFLSGAAGNGPYWSSLSDLEHYNLTFGERIGWKWDAVLRELRLRRWAPRPTKDAAADSRLTLLDWGCGSGVAGRRVIDAFGPARFRALWAWDHSSLAREFTVSSGRQTYPSLEVAEWPRSAAPDVLVVSHVLNELPRQELADLIALVRRAGSVIWVEPGTHAVSRQLIEIREHLRSDLRVVAPCTHGAACGLLAPENARHWCHYFADPPAAIYADSDWVRFGQRAGIDLRSLPYSFLVAESPGLQTPDAVLAPDGTARIVGEARHYKGYAKLLSCDASGVAELTLQKRDEPALFKALKRPEGVPIYRWQRSGDRIARAEPIYPTQP